MAQHIHSGLVITWAWLLASFILHSVANAGSVKVIQLSPSSTVPTDASPPIDPAFPGFAFEERSFVLYAGAGGSPNDFSRNLVNAVAQKTRVSPIVRVGGTSLDHGTYVANQQQPLLVPDDQASRNIPTGLKIGPSYFDSFLNLPDAQYIVDIPLALDDLPNSIQFATAAVKAVPKSQQFAWEIGNEPDTYTQYFDSSQGPAQYVKQWLEYAQSITEIIGASNQDAIYQVYTRATPLTSEQTPPWTVENVFDTGLGDHSSQIKSVSIHYYQTEAGEPLQQDLMDPVRTASRVNYFEQPAQYLTSVYPEIPLVLGEVGSAYNYHGNDGILEGVLGSALWQIDFYLRSMTAGVARINFQSGIGFGYAMWQPTTYQGSAPHVRAPYYGQIFAADFIGPNVQAKTPTGSFRATADGDELRVAVLPATSIYFSAYAAYENGQLSRVALLNLQLWDSMQNRGQRPSKTVSLTVPSGVKSVRIEQLTSNTGGFAGAEGSITWGGMSWTYADNGLGTQQFNDTKIVQVPSNNVVSIEVDASSAVIAYLQN